MSQVERGISRILEAPAPERLRAAARHLCMTGVAKRARPRLVEQFGRAMGVSPRELVDIAVAAELVHSASLLHDDVVDAGTLRRGRPTANVLFGNHAAVLGGDLLLSLALTALREYPTRVSHEAVDVVLGMTCAAIEEVELRGQPNLREEQWRRVAWGKTGLLFGFCGLAPALVAGDGDAAKQFMEAGRRLGVAFQMADDLADLTAEKKDSHADLRCRNPSLVTALASQRSTAFRHRLNELWSAQTEVLDEAAVRELAQLQEQSGAVDGVRELLRNEVALAASALEAYAGRPGVIEIQHWAGMLVETHGRSAA